MLRLLPTPRVRCQPPRCQPRCQPNPRRALDVNPQDVNLDVNPDVNPVVNPTCAVVVEPSSSRRRRGALLASPRGIEPSRRDKAGRRRKGKKAEAAWAEPVKGGRGAHKTHRGKGRTIHLRGERLRLRSRYGGGSCSEMVQIPTKNRKPPSLLHQNLLKLLFFFLATKQISCASAFRRGAC